MVKRETTNPASNGEAVRFKHAGGDEMMEKREDVSEREKTGEREKIGGKRRGRERGVGRGGEARFGSSNWQQVAAERETRQTTTKRIAWLGGPGGVISGRFEVNLGRKPAASSPIVSQWKSREGAPSTRGTPYKVRTVISPRPFLDSFFFFFLVEFSFFRLSAVSPRRHCGHGWSISDTVPVLFTESGWLLRGPLARVPEEMPPPPKSPKKPVGMPYHKLSISRSLRFQRRGGNKRVGCPLVFVQVHAPMVCRPNLALQLVPIAVVSSGRMGANYYY